MIEISKLPGLSRRWQITVYICIGILAGLGLFVGKIANAVSYLSNAPETCMNCHVMTGAYATWQRGSHGKVAVCVDCHVPHDNPVARLAFKAADGMKHSYAFTMRNEPHGKCI